METKLLKSNETEAAAEILKAGGLVAIPTETVYGLAANAFNETAVENIFKAKGRAQDNPLIVHISKFEELSPLVAEIPEKAKKLADKFWPGPLTMIMKKSDKIPSVVTCGMDTVAIRMPRHTIARKIIEQSGLPLAAPSANLSGGVSPTTAEHCIADLTGRVDAILDGGASEVGLESTVILMTTNPPRLLRPGFVTAEQIEEVIGDITIDNAILNPLAEGERPLSPGMKYKHYSPKAKVTIVDADSESYVKFVNSKKADGVFALCFEDDAPLLLVPYIVFGTEDNSECQAQKLFDSLREFDLLGAKKVYARMPSTDGVGLAVCNRLLRAAGFDVIKPKKVIGLTGPTGSGKSTVAKALGLPIIDADKIARLVMQPGHPCLLKCADAFGSDILNPDGSLKRAELAKRAFSTSEKTDLLNKISLPFIKEIIIDEIKKIDCGLVVLDAPQLFEAGCDKLCDYIIGVLANRDIRLSRILSRDKISKEAAQKRMDASKSDEFFKENCDKIIINNGAIDEIDMQKLKEELTAL
jgi:L-threonylcarbamoyladenylate synthase